MGIWIILFALIICAYLLGSVPASYLAARTHGIDLRKQGTSQVGGGNLWRMTSWKLGLPVGLFDFVKGAGMAWIAQALGMNEGQQIVVGLATVAGHNWPVFLRFHGGRGIATTIGIIMILPIINDMTPWPTIVFWIILIGGVLITRKTPVPILFGVASLPVVSWALHQPLSVTLAFLAIFLIIIIKRLMAQPSAGTVKTSNWGLIANRLD